MRTTRPVQPSTIAETMLESSSMKLPVSWSLCDYHKLKESEMVKLQLWDQDQQIYG